ncbi:MAG TPA: carbon-nitrogen hydrolase family protein [Anaerovoracaceae bacterium]|nr:carbon-nitrogen hydrolase family protein [Anaerovoracaceae bacterium]
MKIGIIQNKVNTDEDYTIKHFRELSINMDADILVLPEMFCCPYDVDIFKDYAQEEGESLDLKLSAFAKEMGIYLVAGTVPEKDGERIYNTSYVYDREGNKIAKHRKLHLFEINLGRGKMFREADSLSAGDKITVFDTEFGKMGLAVCFDVRFPEQFRKMSDMGAKVAFVPAAFNLTTGPAHWETLFRSRALDNQIYMIGVSTARDDESKYRAYGHSLIVNPWSEIEGQLGYYEDVLIRDINLDKVEKVRKQLPVINSLRRDIY